MAPFLSGEELERAGKEMAEDARRREALQPPEDPTPRPPFLSLREAMALEENKLEDAKRRKASQQPEDPTYERILALFGELDSQTKLRLLEKLAALVRQAAGQPNIHSILELQGLGKEIWEGLDAQEYLDQERSLWDGQTPRS